MNVAAQAKRAAIAVLEILALTDDADEAHRAIVNRLHGELAAAKREGRREANAQKRPHRRKGDHHEDQSPLKSRGNSEPPPVRFGEQV
jgi:hypothetical protein